MEDNSGGHQPERLEEQLRRMILAGNPPMNTNPASQPSIQSPPIHGHHFSPSHDAGQYNENFAKPGVAPPGNAVHVNDVYNRQQQWNMHHNRPDHWRHSGNVHRGHDHRHHHPHDHGFDPHLYQRGFHRHQHQRDMFYNTAPQTMPEHHQQRARHYQHLPLDPNAFGRNGHGLRHRGGFYGHHHGQRWNQFGPGMRADVDPRLVAYLEQLSREQISEVEMPQAESDAKDAFREALQCVLNDVSPSSSAHTPSISLECFGSLKSGFATRGSDMDLVIVANDHNSALSHLSLTEDGLPRMLEKRLLDLGYGARLLSKTRVPIIKICEKPTPELLALLRQERETWDALPPEQKNPPLHPEEPGDADADDQSAAEALAGSDVPRTNLDSRGEPQHIDRDGQGASKSPTEINAVLAEHTIAKPADEQNASGGRKQQGKGHNLRVWTRERKSGPLDFPKEGVGIQCDINFFNPLGLHNTQMLRCYSLCDWRVRPIILFVKAWAKRRKINSSYSGTLSSYGYVLMVLHYLVNIASPPVIPNLQSSWRPEGDYTPSSEYDEQVDGWLVHFWRNEADIKDAAANGRLTSNNQSVGELLAGFFIYYASQDRGQQFHWVNEILSLRSRSGILRKSEKGWLKATTEQNEGRKVQHRFLFCIEDPFELSHNVARTVTHPGIVAIRDEFRRARRIFYNISTGEPSPDGDLFAPLEESLTVEQDDLPADGEAEDQAKEDGVKQEPLDEATSGVRHDGGSFRRGRGGRGRNRGSIRRGRGGDLQTLDVADNEAFPALGKVPVAGALVSMHHEQAGESPGRGRGRSLRGGRRRREGVEE